MIIRDKYLRILNNNVDTHFIKVLTGIRRVGKSTLMWQFFDSLKNRDANFIEFDFNDIRIVKEYDWEKLTNEIEKRADLNKINYVFLDEIQEIKDFEKCVITLFEHKTLKFDIYITGSNSHMFSSELITLFTGRVKEIITFPFSFKEINQNFLPKENSLNENFKRYIMLGGLGIILNTYNNKDECYDIIETVYNSILKKDLINRHKIKHLNNIEKISKFIFNHIGKNLSINNIENFLISNKEIKINNKTLLNYLKYLEEVYLITKVNFYDTVGKKILLTKAKYYAADLGILSVNTKTDISYNYGYRLENLVLLKLLEEKWKVYTGHDRYNNEIDFIIIKFDIQKYIQVCDELNDENYKRETRSMLNIKNGFEKIILCNHTSIVSKNDGIKIINILQWLNDEVTL